MVDQREPLPTMRDVARASGVSPATVSHVLNGRSKRVSPETREKVLSAIRDLKYKPTPHLDRSQSLKTHNIGYLATELGLSPVSTNDYFGVVLDGIVEVGALHGYSVTIMVDRLWSGDSHGVRRRYDGRCDGLIVSAPVIGDPNLRTLVERGTPVVSVGSTAEYPGQSSVDVDNFEAARRSVAYLWELGHRHIAYAGAGPWITSSCERYAGYVQGLAERGAGGAIFGVFSISSSEEQSQRHQGMVTTPPEGGHSVDGWGAESLHEIVRARPETTAILCWNDDMARGIVRECGRLGWKVPRDLSIVAFDNTAFSRDLSPQLTTNIQPLADIGRRATRILIDAIDNPDHQAEVVRFMPDFVVRESTSSPRPTPYLKAAE